MGKNNCKNCLITTTLISAANVSLTIGLQQQSRRLTSINNYPNKRQLIKLTSLNNLPLRISQKSLLNGSAKNNTSCCQLMRVVRFSRNFFRNCTKNFGNQQPDNDYNEADNDELNDSNSDKIIDATAEEVIEENSDIDLQETDNNVRDLITDNQNKQSIDDELNIVDALSSDSSLISDGSKPQEMLDTVLSSDSSLISDLLENKELLNAATALSSDSSLGFYLLTNPEMVDAAAALLSDPSEISTLLGNKDVLETVAALSSDSSMMSGLLNNPELTGIIATMTNENEPAEPNANSDNAGSSQNESVMDKLGSVFADTASASVGTNILDLRNALAQIGDITGADNEATNKAEELGAVSLLVEGVDIEGTNGASTTGESAASDVGSKDTMVNSDGSGSAVVSSTADTASDTSLYEANSTGAFDDNMEIELSTDSLATGTSDMTNETEDTGSSSTTTLAADSTGAMESNNPTELTGVAATVDESQVIQIR